MSVNDRNSARDLDAADNAGDGEFDDSTVQTPVLWLAIPLGISAHGVGTYGWFGAHRSHAVQREPATTVDLADRGGQNTGGIEQTGLLRRRKGDHADGLGLVIPRKPNRCHMDFLGRNDQRKRRKVTFGQELEGLGGQRIWRVLHSVEGTSAVGR